MVLVDTLREVLRQIFMGILTASTLALFWLGFLCVYWSRCYTYGLRPLPPPLWVLVWFGLGLVFFPNSGAL